MKVIFEELGFETSLEYLINGLSLDMDEVKQALKVSYYENNSVIIEECNDDLVGRSCKDNFNKGIGWAPTKCTGYIKDYNLNWEETMGIISCVTDIEFLLVVKDIMRGYPTSIPSLSEPVFYTRFCLEFDWNGVDTETLSSSTDGKEYTPSFPSIVFKEQKVLTKKQFEEYIKIADELTYEDENQEIWFVKKKDFQIKGWWWFIRDIAKLNLSRS